MTTQDILDFLAASRPTADQLPSFVEDLKSRINQLSVAVPNESADSITVLYSGLMADGTHAEAMATSLAAANPGKVVTINQTQVCELLNSLEFKDELLNALGNDNTAYTNLLNGSNINGQRIPDSLWDDASRRFAQNATGDVRVIAPEGDASKIFAQTELPALLANPNVTHIDGIPREQLIALRDAKGLAAVQQFTFDNSRLKAVIGGLAQGDFQKYLDPARGGLFNPPRTFEFRRNSCHAATSEALQQANFEDKTGTAHS